MKLKIIAGVLVALLFVSMTPGPRALADGAASTRNILLGIGAAAGTLLIINHNKQVHAKYAQDAAAQAALANQRNDAEAAYQSEVRAYKHQVAVSDNLQKEVALQDATIQQQKKQLAEVGVSVQPVAQAPVIHAGSSHSAPAKMAMSQMVSYGWGTL